VRVWGRVTEKATSPQPYLVIDCAGAQARVEGSSTAAIGDYVIVTGVSSSSATLPAIPTILIRHSSDVRVISAAQ